MKLPISRDLLITGAAMLALGWILGAMLGGGHNHGAAVGAEDASVWTCSMHPHVRQPKAGKCPICAMDLIPQSEAAGKHGGPPKLVMTHAARELAKIATAPVERRFVEAEIRLVGKVALDETSTKTVAAYFPARIDRLYVDYQGIQVREGDHLARVYSPELLSAQTELLTALRYGSNVDVARDKLRLWGLSDERIRAIEESKKTSDKSDIDTPLGGIVIRKAVNEGDYVKTGQPLFTIADLSTVWVQLDAYESDLPWLRFGQPVEFEAEALPGQKLKGTVAFVSPMLDPKTRTVAVRVNAENPGQILKPDMFVHATVRATLTGRGKVVAPNLAGKWISPMHPEVVRDEPGNCPVCGMALVKAEDLGYTVLNPAQEPPLVVPSSAVLRTGRRSVVYVETPQADRPTYEGREVLVGPRAGNFYLVEEGLEEGERVVVNGAFKIDSALQIVAKPSMMSTDGNHSPPAEPDFLTHEVSPEFRQQLGAAVRAYDALKSALAADDFATAKSAAATFREMLGKIDAGLLEGEANLAWAKNLGPLQSSNAKIAEAIGIKAARAEFQPLSDVLTRSVRQFGVSGVDALHIAHCWMAFDYKGASWLQTSPEIRNPYFGAEMLQCGSVEETLIPAPKDSHDHAKP